MGKHAKIEKCEICGRATHQAYICRRCSNELHDLLVGSHEPDGQPGIMWYAKRLRESAYGQTRMARSAAARSSATGYALLGNHRAVELLGRINVVLARWEGIVERLSATHSHETGSEHMGSLTRDSERLECKRARYVAAHVVLLRHHSRDVPKLYNDLLNFARESWRIINRPNDICCGPCPTWVNPTLEQLKSGPAVTEIQCSTMLYAEENKATVQCSSCRTIHDVDELRDGLKTFVQDMLFTRSDLVKLMETRLNDRIPQPTFTKLLRDGRLQPRRLEAQVNDDGTTMYVAMFTYDDVCEARLKDPPQRKIRAVS